MPLMSITDAKRILLIKSATGEFDALLNELVANVNKFIATACNRVLEEATYRELYDGSGEYSQTLNNAPIVSVSVLSDSLDLENKKYSSPISTANILIDGNAGIIELFTQAFPAGKRNIYIEYLAGFGGSGAGAVAYPLDLKQVACELVAKKFNDYQEKRININSKSIMGENVSFTFEEVTAIQKEIIRKYRKPIRENTGLSVSAFSLA